MKRLLQLVRLSGLLTALAWAAPAQATFPAFAAACTLSDSGASNTTSHVITLPASIASGDLILVYMFKDGGGTATIPGLWVEIKDILESTSTVHLYVAYLIASGGETSVTITSTVSERHTAIACRITAATWHGTQAPEISTGVGGASQDGPNPDAVTASYGSDDNLFIAIACVDINATVDGYPSSYPDNQTASGTLASAGHGGIATRNLAASNDDPGIFSLTASEQWIAATMVVRGAGGGGTAAPPTLMMQGVGD